MELEPVMSMPDKIGRYEINHALGQGGMAVVYLARDPLMDRQVAVKLLPRQLTFDESLRSRFQKEARIVASLEHPAIVPVHDFGEFNEQPFLVMRYMVGGSLSDQLRDGPLSLPEVVRILSPLAQALDKAHAQHIIHRDLKPDNILFDGDDNPYLSDFGIARLAEGTQTQSIMGTPAYMSPEQIKGDVELDGRSDIYALGVILFEMLSGEQPYTAETPTQVMMKHVLEPVPMILDKVSDLPPMTQMVIDRAMAKERDDRYASAEDLVEGIKELLTASQAAEVGAAMAGTMLQETMLEIPQEEIDPYATVIERPVPALDSTIEPVERMAVDEPELATKKSAPHGRQVLLLGCAVGIMLVLCLIVLGLIGNSLGWGQDSEAPKRASSNVGDVLPAVTEADLLQATPVVHTEIVETQEPTIDTMPETVENLPPGVLFADDFDSQSSAANWDIWKDESADFGVGNGRMIALGYDDSTLNWVKQYDSYTDLELSVTADILEGGESAFFGIVYSGDGDNYVGCFVQGDNSAYCGEQLDGETEFGDWVVVDVSALWDNEILFVINDDEWAMSVNNKCVGSGLVQFGPQGQPGLVVSTANNEAIASIAYDDYLIRTPTEQGLALLQCDPEFYE